MDNSTNATESDATIQAPPLPSDHLVKVEANLLRLPFFALHTKGLKTCPGFEFSGQYERKNHKYEFKLTVTRNLKRSYPGLKSRAAHLALLDIATERALPIENPITWSWRDLCRRMGIAYSGRTVSELQDAILATRGLEIDSQQAIWLKHRGKPLLTKDKNKRRVTGLYSDVSFIDRKQADGTTTDFNGVWFSDWFLENWNALHSAPLDYDLWRWLDRESPVASRLYELGISKFYKTQLLRINYPTLASSLPIRPERYYSHAQKQLHHAFNTVVNAKVYQTPQWAKRKPPILAQLLLRPGPRLADAQDNTFIAQDETFTSFTFRELSDISPEATMVADFYRLLRGAEKKPSTKELDEARLYIKQYGPQRTPKLLRTTIARLKTDWPDAKTFAALRTYLPEVAAEQAKNQRAEVNRRRKARQDKQQQADEDRQRLERQQFIKHWQPAWDDLPESEQDAIRQGVIGDNPILAKHSTSSLVLEQCFRELERRSQAPKRSPK